MADGLQPITQADFSAGAWPGYEDVPPNGVEDIVDGFIRDDAAIERRGGTTYITTADAGEELLSIWDGYLAAGQRTVTWNSAERGDLYVLDNAGTGFTVIDSAAFANVKVGTPTEVAGLLLIPAYDASNEVFYMTYAGSRKTASYFEPFGMTFTAGSTAVTGAGTTFSGNVDAGMLISPTASTVLPIVKSVESDTALTLLYPPDASSVETNTTFYPAMTTAATNINDVLLSVGPIHVTNAYGRLITAREKRVAFSASGNPYAQGADDYHELPEGSFITGVRFTDGLTYVFTTNGTWAITNMAYDLTDALGNPQQALELVSRDLILWDEKGIASWDGRLVVPAIDDVRLLGKDGGVLTGGARKLYREYVKAGYQTGQGAVYRGHYFLPILNGTTPVDQLVWRLDAGNALTRWSGHAGSARALSVRSGSTTRQPRLLGVAGQRIIELTDTLQPSSTVKNDATGTAHQLKVTSRSIMLSETQDHTLRFGRLRYELDDAATDNPTFTAEWARGRPGSTFTALSGSASEGEDTYPWTLAKSGQQTRMRFTSNNASSKAIVRAMEFKVRQHGRT